MEPERRLLHLIREHDFSQPYVARLDDEERRNTHALEHKGEQDHEHEEGGY